MAGGALATIGFFFFDAPASYAGLGAFALAAVGMVAGSLASGRDPRRGAQLTAILGLVLLPVVATAQPDAPPGRARATSQTGASRADSGAERSVRMGLVVA
jgi:hypothetical protein